MRDQIQQLISNGETEEALNLLTQYNKDAILLQARYRTTKKQYTFNQISYDEWQMVQSQINFAILEMADELEDESSSPNDSKPTQAEPAKPAPGPGVFISYNHRDKDTASRIKEFLETNGVAVKIDQEDMAVGQNIKEFILDQIKNNHSVLSLVSKNSLRSGWVGLESDLAMYSQLLNDKSFIPVMIDSGLFDGDFYFEIIQEIDAKIKDLDGKIDKARSLNIGYKQFENERSRLHDQRNKLDDIIDYFQNVLVEDISADKFETGMNRVLKVLK
jgi:hypothetical protein